MAKQILVVLLFTFLVLTFTACKKEADEPEEQRLSAQRAAAREAAKFRDEEMRKAPPITTASESDGKQKNTTRLAVSGGDIAAIASTDETQLSRDIKTTQNILANVFYSNPITEEWREDLDEKQLNAALERISKLMTVEKVERDDTHIKVTFLMLGEMQWEYSLE
jgi:murein L,D-transpeptidase YcbB/YkuD